MKLIKSVFFTSLLLFFAFGIQAQTSGADYFTGKWNVLLKNLPTGDSKIFIVLDKGDSTLSGIVQDSTGKEISKIDKIEIAETTATVYFSAQGYDVNLLMNKKDDDHVTGSLMGMFDAEGERVKQ